MSVIEGMGTAAADIAIVILLGHFMAFMVIHLNAICIILHMGVVHITVMATIAMAMEAGGATMIGGGLVEMVRKMIIRTTAVA